MTSPTFCARFADGTKIRMTVWHSPERGSFDLRRGVRLARHAYATRMHDPFVENAQRVAAPPHRGLARETLTLLVDGREQRLEVVRQERYLGGTQAYWTCPRCSALRSDLYVLDGVLACRCCHRLTYRSRVQRHKAVLRVARLRRKLGAEPSMLAPIPRKPPRWRHAYYDRLVAELAEQEAILAGMLDGIVQALERRKGRLHGPR